jgi:predicted DNA-binding transcriptional regulator AlpA
MDNVQEHIAYGLNAILSELRAQRVRDDLWTADDVALYLKIKKSTFQQRLQNSDSFPRPRTLPTTGSGGGKRWIAEEVRQWAKEQ